jgi:hypothetical protein
LRLQLLNFAPLTLKLSMLRRHLVLEAAFRVFAILELVTDYAPSQCAQTTTNCGPGAGMTNRSTDYSPGTRA